jgi:hypothetical protein
VLDAHVRQIHFMNRLSEQHSEAVAILRRLWASTEHASKIYGLAQLHQPGH